MSRAHELGLGRRNARVVYPPVAPRFAWHDENAQAQRADGARHRATGTCC